MTAKWSDPRPSRQGNTDLAKTNNRRRRRTRQGRTFLRFDLAALLRGTGWR
jgi:hypothetical protein